MAKCKLTRLEGIGRTVITPTKIEVSFLFNEGGESADFHQRMTLDEVVRALRQLATRLEMRK